MDKKMDRTVLVETYLNAWNETDSDKCRAILTKVWTEHCTYTDPLAEVAGVDQIEALISGFQKKLPGALLKRTGVVEAHHNLARFTWDLLTPTGDIVAKGMDVAVFSEDHRIESVLGFFDQAPAIG